LAIRVVVADDHSVVLQGVRSLLSIEPDLEIVALCTDGVEAMEAVEECNPDVLVMDVTMPRLGGLDAHEALREQGRIVPTLLFTAILTDELLLRCMRSSLEGVVLKESAAELLVDAIRSVAGGERWFSSQLLTRAVALMAEDALLEGAVAGLTGREAEVARLVASGMSNKKVASDLGIAESTVKLHLHNVFTKLGVTNRTQLSVVVRERGLS